MKIATAFKIGQLVCRPHIRDGVHTGAWQVDVPPHCSPDGRRKRWSFKSKGEAEQAAQRLVRSREVRNLVEGRVPQSMGITLQELAKEWLEEQVARVKAGIKREASLHTNAHQLKAVLGFMGSLDVAAISSRKVLDYQQERARLGMRPPTINSETAILRQVLKWGLDKEICRAIPRMERIPVPPKRVDIPTPQEVAAIMQALPPVEALIVRFLAETGCRKSEAFNLHWEDLDDARHLVRIRRKEGFTPKTDHSDREIFVSPSLIRDLRRAKRHEVLVFPGRSGVVRTNMEKVLRSAVVEAGVVRSGRPLNLTLKVLRNTHATWLAMEKTPAVVLQQRLGHAPGTRTTDRYYVMATQKAAQEAVITIPSARRRRPP